MTFLEIMGFKTSTQKQKVYKKKYAPHINIKMSRELIDKAHIYAHSLHTTLSDLMRYLLIKELNKDKKNED
jgi:hypothetical protein